MLFDGERKEMREKREFDEAMEKAERGKKRGGQKSSARFKRKRKNIIDRDFVNRRAAIEAASAKRLKSKKEMEREQSGKARSALDRFGA